MSNSVGISGKAGLTFSFYGNSFEVGDITGAAERDLGFELDSPVVDDTLWCCYIALILLMSTDILSDYQN